MKDNRGKERNTLRVKQMRLERHGGNRSGTTVDQRARREKKKGETPNLKQRERGEKGL